MKIDPDKALYTFISEHRTEKGASLKARDNLTVAADYLESQGEDPYLLRLALEREDEDPRWEAIGSPETPTADSGPGLYEMTPEAVKWVVDESAEVWGAEYQENAINFLMGLKDPWVHYMDPLYLNRQPNDFFWTVGALTKTTVWGGRSESPSPLDRHRDLDLWYLDGYVTMTDPTLVLQDHKVRVGTKEEVVNLASEWNWELGNLLDDSWVLSDGGDWYQPEAEENPRRSSLKKKLMR